MKRIEWCLAITFILIGFAILLIALSLPPGGIPAGAPALALLLKSVSLQTYGTAHVGGGLAHVYALLREPRIRKIVLTLEMILALFIGILSFLLSGFQNPTAIYAVFTSLVAGTARTGKLN